MDQTNRVLTVGIAFLWIFLVFIVILLAWGAPDQSIDRLGDLVGYMEDHNNAEAKLIITFGGLILILLAAIVIILEVAPPEGGSLKVEKIGAGEARIGTDEVALQLEEELRTLPHMNQVQATVVARGQKAEVNLILHVAPEADLAATSEEACRRARSLIEERMGVALTRPPQAQIHYRELRLSQQQPAPPPTTVEAPGAAPPPPPLPESSPVGASPPTATEPAHEPSETPQEDRPAGA